MSMQTETIEIGLSVNGRSHRLAVPPSATLLEEIGRGVEVHQMDEEVAGRAIEWLSARRGRQ